MVFVGRILKDIRLNFHKLWQYFPIENGFCIYVPPYLHPTHRPPSPQGRVGCVRHTTPVDETRSVSSLVAIIVNLHNRAKWYVQQHINATVWVVNVDFVRHVGQTNDFVHKCNVCCKTHTVCLKVPQTHNIT
jgi:hypothetical protein